jgi:uncharacterized protein GlcG (DUF336 family)
MSIRFRTLVAVAAALSVWSGVAGAQITFVTPSNDDSRAPRPQRDRGPALAPSILAAQQAVQACEAQGYPVTAAVVDSAGTAVVLLSGDGAALVTQSIAMGKAVSAAKNGISSADLAKLSQTDTALAAKLAADPQQGPQRGGGIPIKEGGNVIGAIAVSGTPNPGVDADCAQAGLDKVNAKTKPR